MSTGIVVTGAGAVQGACDSTPHLKMRKNRKLMARQDELAVVAAARALAHAGLGTALGPRVGLYLAVGFIAFDATTADLLLQSSVDESGRFCLSRFSTHAMREMSPLQTFRCLSNMPAFHVSLNFDVQGPYLVTYPGPGQLYVALEEAAAALRTGEIDVALLGGVADQTNFLVEHHFARVDPPVPRDRLGDAAGVVVLERAEDAGTRARARLLSFDLTYRPHDPFTESLAPREWFAGVEPPNHELGPASLTVALGGALGQHVEHRVEARDGLLGASVWGPA